MEKIKSSISVKTAAYIIIVLCSVMTVLSAIIVVMNAEYQWYGKSGAAVSRDIYGKVAEFANNELIENMVYDEDRGGVIEEDAELIYEEALCTDFGYRITVNADDSISDPVRFEENGSTTNIRAVNEDFIKSGDAQFEYTFIHSYGQIDIYLGEISKESIPEDLFRHYSFLSAVHKYGKTAAVTAVLGVLIMIILFVFFFVTTGKRKEIGRTAASIPIELCVLIAAGLGALLAMFNSAMLWDMNTELVILMIVVDTAAVVSVALGLMLITVLKARHHVLWQSSICFKIYRALAWIGNEILFLLQSIPLVWKSTLICLTAILINLFITVQIQSGYGGVWLMWFIGAVITEGIVIYAAVGLKKLKTAGKCMADGDLEHKIDEKGLFLDLREHAENLNSISEGMSKAVEDKMKSERFKTELITNVSHDIKTPLTSIINYVDLLAAEEIEDEKIREYIEVLDRQAGRLKKLTDDLVDASKAAAGTVKLDMAPCRASVLMMQACGEYDSKMKEKHLTLITDIDDENVDIMADGKSMWRIFDNILNNICKYSQPETRVYQSLEKREDKVVITYKNTSGYQLNISEEELMERFVRGDSSRHTEGSGLGLSIARNLARLQGGNLTINIDGDLFKVIMEFPALS